MDSIELSVANALLRYHREQQGIAPERIEVRVCGTLITALSNGIYTPTELQLSQHEAGRMAVKSARRELRSLTRESAHAAIAGACPVLRSYWDLDVRIGEQMEAYVLAEDISARKG